MFTVSSDKTKLQPQRMLKLLQNTYWAKKRTLEQMLLAVEHSVCFGAYLRESGEQIGLVRVMTDFVTAFYICDVVVDPAFRGLGVGKALMEAAVSDSRYCHLRGLLVTSDAHGLYEKYGFTPANSRHMGREPDSSQNSALSSEP